MTPFYVVCRVKHEGLCFYCHQAYEWFQLIAKFRKKWHANCLGCTCHYCDPAMCNHGNNCIIVDRRPCPNCWGFRCRHKEGARRFCRYVVTAYVRQHGKYLAVQYNNISSRSRFMEQYFEKVNPLLDHLDQSFWNKSQLYILMNNIPDNALVARIDFLENIKHERGNELQREFYSKLNTTLFIITVWYQDGGNVIKEFYEFYSSYLPHKNEGFQKFFAIFMENFLFPRRITRIILLSDNARQHFHNTSNFLWCSRFFGAYGLHIEWHFDPPYHGKGACDARGAVIKRGLRFFLLGPGQDIADVQQLTDFTNEHLHSAPHAGIDGIASNIHFDDDDGYHHVPTLLGNASWFSYRYTREEYIVYTRHWPCYCVHCLAQHWDRCQNIVKCGPWVRRNCGGSDKWIAAQQGALDNARQYAQVNIVASSNSSDEDYEVQKILAKRTASGHNTTEYLVKWRGWDTSFNEWLPESSLAASRNLIRRFNNHPFQ